MLEIGVVEKLNNNGKNAKVTFPRRTECDKCGMCMKHKNDMKVSIIVKNTLNARVGDRVSVGMKDGFVLRAAFIVYVIPVILIGLTVGLGRNLNELLLFGLAMAALLVGLAISVLCDRAIRKKGVALPQMVEIISRRADEITEIESEEAENKERVEEPEKSEVAKSEDKVESEVATPEENVDSEVPNSEDKAENERKNGEENAERK